MIAIFIMLYIIMCISISAQRTMEMFDMGNSWGFPLLMHFAWGALLAPVYGAMSMIAKLSEYSFEELMNPYNDFFDVDYEEINEDGNKENSSACL